MSDEPKLRHQGDWEKIKHIAKIIETEYENESMALWAAEAIFQYVNENPAVSVHYIRREKAEAWENGVRASRAYDRQLTRWGKSDGGGGPFAPPEELRNPYTED